MFAFCESRTGHQRCEVFFVRCSVIFDSNYCLLWTQQLYGWATAAVASQLSSPFVAVVWLSSTLPILEDCCTPVYQWLEHAHAVEFCVKTMWTERHYVTCITRTCAAARVANCSKDEDARAFYEDVCPWSQLSRTHGLSVQFCNIIIGGAINTTEAYTRCWFYCVDCICSAALATSSCSWDCM